MTVDRFVDDRRASWDELRDLLDAARGRPERLGAVPALRLGTLYRQASADLAVARRKYALDPIVPPLEELVSRGRDAVYSSVARREALRDFLATRYWRRVMERPGPLILAAVLLIAPAIIGFVWGRVDPAQAGGFVPGSLEAVTRARPSGADLGLTAGQSAAMSSEIFTNNIQVALAALAGGMTAGIVTVGSLLFNGLMVGVFAGLASGAGAAGVITELVVPHGVLELSVIVVAGAAGLRLADALLAPGLRTRGEALVAEGRAATELALGSVPWLVLAGLVEGFVTPAGVGVVASLVVGFGLAAVYWGLAWRRGSDPGAGLEAQVGADARSGETVGPGLHHRRSSAF